MKKRNLMIALLLAVLLTFSACTQGTGSTASSAGADDSVAVTVNEADYFSDRDRSGAWDESKAVSITLNGNSAACDGSGVEIDGSVVQTFVTSVMEKGSVRAPELPVVSQT